MQVKSFHCAKYSLYTVKIVLHLNDINFDNNLVTIINIPTQVVLSTLDAVFSSQDLQDDCPVKFWYCPSAHITQLKPLKYLPGGHLTIKR